MGLIEQISKILNRKLSLKKEMERKLKAKRKEILHPYFLKKKKPKNINVTYHKNVFNIITFLTAQLAHSENSYCSFYKCF